MGHDNAITCAHLELTILLLKVGARLQLKAMSKQEVILQKLEKCLQFEYHGKRLVGMDYHNTIPSPHHLMIIAYYAILAPLTSKALSTILRLRFSMGNYHPIIRPVF